MRIQDVIKLIADRWELELRIQAIEKWFATEIEEKNRIIDKQEEEIRFLRGIIQNLSQRAVIENNVEVTMTASSESKRDTYKQSGNFGIGHMSGGEIQEGAKVAGVINEAEQQQSLAEAATEIQQLLKQLEESNPTATEAEQQAFVTAALLPTKRSRLVNAVKAGGKAAIEEFLDNPYLNTAIAIIEGWNHPN